LCTSGADSIFRSFVVITLLGAQGTGKTWLARALAEALAASWPNLWMVESAKPLPFKQTGHILLMGLDWPPALPAALEARATQDAQLRAALAQAGAEFQVVYGTGPARLRNALSAFEAVVRPPSGNAAAGHPATWPWHCDACSEPDCEHRLFTSLQAQRLTGAAAARPAS
jgi:hypothetical protein